MKTYKPLLMVLLAVLACACDDKRPQRTVIDPQLKTLEKARGVEGTLEQRAQRQRAEEQKLNIETEPKP